TESTSMLRSLGATYGTSYAVLGTPDEGQGERREAPAGSLRQKLLSKQASAKPS
ncbi:unnamed protein product, partial [marine sediment metagenome]